MENKGTNLRLPTLFKAHTLYTSHATQQHISLSPWHITPTFTVSSQHQLSDPDHAICQATHSITQHEIFEKKEDVYLTPAQSKCNCPGNTTLTQTLMPRPPTTTAPQHSQGNDNLNEIINEINNPRLLSDKDPTENVTNAASPSNSPAKKKPKTTQTTKTDTPIAEASANPGKKKSKKCTASSSASPASVLKPGRYSGPNPGPDENAPPPTHNHRHQNILLEISIDFNKEGLEQFEGDNGKKTVYAIQQFLINLKIADKLATLNPAEGTTDEPPLGGQSAHPIPTNMTALSICMKGLNPRAFQSSCSRQDQQDTGLT
jgi:hypothetical protein